MEVKNWDTHRESNTRGEKEREIEWKVKRDTEKSHNLNAFWD